MFSPYYAHARHRRTRRSAEVDANPLEHCAINVALYGKAGRRWSMTERSSDRVRRDATCLTIGPSALEWSGDTLRIKLDEVSAPLPLRIKGTIEVHCGARPAHRVALDRHGRHSWGVITPNARIAVKLDAPRLVWSGSAYLDSNRGSAPLEHDFIAWDWSRAHLKDGRTAVVYDVERRDDEALAIAHCFDDRGHVEAFAAPPIANLSNTRWGLSRATRSSSSTAPRVAQSFEDGPFYSRSLVTTEWLGQRVTSVHEHLSLRRFQRRWVRALLPFRMPRRFF